MRKIFQDVILYLFIKIQQIGIRTIDHYQCLLIHLMLHFGVQVHLLVSYIHTLSIKNRYVVK